MFEDRGIVWRKRERIVENLIKTDRIWEWFLELVKAKWLGQIPIFKQGAWPEQWKREEYKHIELGNEEFKVRK